MPSVYNPPISTYTKLASYTTTGSDGNITFSNIPNTYRDLVFVLEWPGTNGDHYTQIIFNNDSTSSYGRRQFGNFNNGESRYSTTSEAAIYNNTAYGAQGNYVYMHIFDYAQTNKFKPTISRSGSLNASLMSANYWKKTDAITSINVTITGGGSLNQHSTLSLYGIKG